MRDDIHERAQKLIATSRGNGMAMADQTWLQRHLDECPACAQYAEEIEGVVRALRSVSVMPSPGLVHVTKMNVRLRARELAEQQARLRPLWIACTLAILLTVVTTPYLWWGFEWMGRALGLPDMLWQTSFLVSWALPATLATALVIARQTHFARQQGA